MMHQIDGYTVSRHEFGVQGIECDNGQFLGMSSVYKAWSITVAVSTEKSWAL